MCAEATFFHWLQSWHPFLLIALFSAAQSPDPESEACQELREKTAEYEGHATRRTWVLCLQLCLPPLCW